VTEIECVIIGLTEVDSDGTCPTKGWLDQAYSPLCNATRMFFLPRIPGICSSLEKIEMVLVYHTISF
jgi:hypothetical protein